MNRAIHAETLKTRLDNDGQLTGYLDEMINDCPSVRPDMNSAADEFFTKDTVEGKWLDFEAGLKGLNEMRRKWVARSGIAGDLDDKAVELANHVDAIFNAICRGSQMDVQNAIDAFDAKMIDLLRYTISAAGFLQIDVEKYLRGKHATAGN